jgi:TonB family protein
MIVYLFEKLKIIKILISLLLLFIGVYLFGQPDTLAPKLIIHDAYMDFVIENLRYPEDAAKKGIRGRVDFSFFITPVGCIDSIKIDNSPHDLLSREVIRVMEKTACEWIPGRFNGILVGMTLSSFINFKLE